MGALVYARCTSPHQSSIMLGSLVIFAVAITNAASERQPYIVGGGDVAEPGSYPWQASLQRGHGHTCGASLLTAAHCAKNAASEYSVIVGAYDIHTKFIGEPKELKVAEFIVHPDYESDMDKGLPNDLALIRLAEEADLTSSFVSAIEVTDETQDFSEKDCMITGWGATGRGYNPGPASNFLQEAPVEFWSDYECDRVSGNRPAPDHICVGVRGETASCNGDSGGPLQCRNGDSWVLVGASSYGYMGCNPFWPSVYTKVSYFKDWISSVTGI